MSRIGKNPAIVSTSVIAQVNGQDASAKGPKNELSVSIPAPITIELKDNEIVASRPGDRRKSHSLHDLSRSLVNNMVVGVTEGYTIKMGIFGVGYRTAKKGKDLGLPLGHLHPILIEAPEGITFDADGTTKLSTTGINRQQVGQLAVNICHLRKDDSYKGKGIRYNGEQIRRKIGEAGK